MRKKTMALATLGACFALALGACGGGNTPSGPTSSGSGGSGGTGLGGGGGGSPCDPGSSCTLGHTCLSLTDNASVAAPGLRIAQITSSTSTGAYNLLFNTVTMATCDVSQMGTNHWLLQLDLAASTLSVGTAKPMMDPLTGFSFINQVIGTTQVSPAVMAMSLGANGDFSAPMGADLTVPVSLDPSSTVLVPIHELRVSGVISADYNCIGHFNGAGLDPANGCMPDDTHPAYVNDGALDYVISLAEADDIDVGPLAQSLCVILSGDPVKYGDAGVPITRCKSLDFGNWCFANNSPASAGCADAIHVDATFAASAVKVIP